jgi:hypothetical protein
MKQIGNGNVTEKLCQNSAKIFPEIYQANLQALERLLRRVGALSR